LHQNQPTKKKKIWEYSQCWDIATILCLLNRVWSKSHICRFCPILPTKNSTYQYILFTPSTTKPFVAKPSQFGGRVLIQRTVFNVC
jgi:hypothetical protein